MLAYGNGDFDSTVRRRHLIVATWHNQRVRRQLPRVPQVAYCRGTGAGRSAAMTIAGWAKDMAVFRRNLGEVQKISHQLIVIIEGESVPNGKERESE